MAPWTAPDLTRPWPLGLNARNWPLHAGVVALALALAVWLDVPASRAAIGWPDPWRAFFFWITDYGMSEWVLIPAVCVLVLALLAMSAMRAGLARRAVYEVALFSGYVFVGVGGPMLINNLIKRLVGRGRPAVFDEVGGFDFRHLLNDVTYQSFPSGHTVSAVSIAFVVGFLWPRLFWPFFALGVLVGISRVPVAMHYPSDVVGGLVVAVLMSYAVRNSLAAHRTVFRKDPDGRIRPRGFPALRRLRQRALR